MEGIERIRILASEIKDEALLKIVNYLMSRRDMNEKYLNEEKTLKQMVSFIKEKAKKRAKDGMAMIEDEVVYSWAIHYFDEANENLKLAVTTIKESEDNSIKNTEKKFKNKKYVAEGQLSLFDI